MRYSLRTYVCNAGASRLLNTLIFDKGKDLRLLPLIPLEDRDLLIAGWVFGLYLHFDAWIRLAMEEEPRLRDMHANCWLRIHRVCGKQSK